MNPVLKQETKKPKHLQSVMIKPATNDKNNANDKILTDESRVFNVLKATSVALKNRVQ